MLISIHAHIDPRKNLTNFVIAHFYFQKFKNKQTHDTLDFLKYLSWKNLPFYSGLICMFHKQVRDIAPDINWSYQMQS